MPTVEQLPAVNAGLNFLATTLLLVGYGLIKMDRVRLHVGTMLAAFSTSVAFLVSYVVYHWQIGGGKHFEGPPTVRAFYLTMLASHVVLAAVVPFLAVATIYLGLTQQWLRHRRLARWTFPIWLYVSITGVLIYLFLYVFFPGTDPSSTIS
jgi:uncharacterized membrane protein YozB (DUF420 family)